jgi:predicted metal-dependent peptidase
MNTNNKLDPVAEARAKLVLGKRALDPFFATIALTLRVVETDDPSVCPRASVDGQTLWVNVPWFTRLPVEERVAVFAHEVMHVALGHHLREGSRDHRLWNVACDLAINHILVMAGYRLPPRCCVPGEGPFKKYVGGLSAEEYYELLKEDESAQSWIKKSWNEGSIGDVMPHPALNGGNESSDEHSAARAQAEAELRSMLQRALARVRSRGDIPSDLARQIDELMQPRVNWRSLLRQYVQAAAKTNYTWSMPNRRHVWRGIYLPSRRDENLGEVVVAIDTSGSIDKKQLTAFLSELNGILNDWPGAKAYVVYCDCKVHRVEEYGSEELPIQPADVPGGGGTSHVPVWEWLAKQDFSPSVVVCLTDGDTQFGNDPGVPVVWCLTAKKDVPFGQKVLIEE